MTDAPATTPTLEEDVLQQWIGRTRQVDDLIRPEPARGLHATLDCPGSPPARGDTMPPAWHWLYFLEITPLSAAGRDGHPKRGDFLPPVALPRRMWAGGRLRFEAPIRIGEALTKHSTVLDVQRKSGRSGELCFVTVRHEIRAGASLKMSEEHDIVYREDPKPDAPIKQPAMAPDGETRSADISYTTTKLFRYSALTFNGHRIHYDEAYARRVEGYDGLVVHGPLLAQHLMLLATRRLGVLKEFTYRATAPLLHHETGQLCAKADSYWVAGPDGRQCMIATAR